MEALGIDTERGQSVASRGAKTDVVARHFQWEGGETSGASGYLFLSSQRAVLKPGGQRLPRAVSSVQ